MHVFKLHQGCVTFMSIIKTVHKVEYVTPHPVTKLLQLKLQLDLIIKGLFLITQFKMVLI